MLRYFLKSKIHRATVTGADVGYEGSITIDVDLMEAADILPYEKVQIYDVTNGTRLSTYAIVGKRGSGEVCINGAAANLVNEGDIIIIASYVMVQQNEVLSHKPKLVYVNEKNQIVKKT